MDPTSEDLDSILSRIIRLALEYDERKGDSYLLESDWICQSTVWDHMIRNALMLRDLYGITLEIEGIRRQVVIERETGRYVVLRAWFRGVRIE